MRAQSLECHNFWFGPTGGCRVFRVSRQLRNHFKPLLLFFCMGFSISLLRVPVAFAKVIYQGLTMSLLNAIGWQSPRSEIPSTSTGAALSGSRRFVAPTPWILAAERRVRQF